MTDTTIPVLQERLDQQRALLRYLLSRAAPDAQTDAARAEIAAIKRRLCYLGAAAAEHPGDLGPRGAPAAGGPERDADTLPELWAASLLRCSLAGPAELGAPADEHAWSKTLLALVHALIRDSQPEIASTLTDHIPDQTLRTEAQARVTSVLSPTYKHTSAPVRPEIDERTFSYALAGSAAGLAGKGQIEQAAALLQQIPEGPDRHHGLLLAAAELARVREAAAATAMLSQIPAGEYRTTALATVATALAQAHEVAAASDLAAQLPDGEQRAYVLSEVAAALAAQGQVAEAVALARQLPEDPQAWGLGEVALTQVRAGALDAAAALAPQLPQGLRRDEVLVEVADALAAQGRTDAALALADQIATAYVWAEARVTLVIRLLRTGALARALELLQPDRASPRGSVWDLAWPVDLSRLIPALVQAQQLEAVAAGIRQIGSAYVRGRALQTLAAELAAHGRWDSYAACVDQIAALRAEPEAAAVWGQLVLQLQKQSDLATVQRAVRHLWGQATRRDDLYALLSAALPLLIAEPDRLARILAARQQVRARLGRL